MRNLPPCEGVHPVLRRVIVLLVLLVLLLEVHHVVLLLGREVVELEGQEATKTIDWLLLLLGLLGSNEVVIFIAGHSLSAKG